ncbi:DUF4340 domain-containing protein [Halochromatium sp.]
MSDPSNGATRLFRNPFSRIEPSWRRALLSPAVGVLIMLLIAQLVAALVLASNAMRATPADAPLFDLASEQVTRIEISSDDQQLVLVRAPEGWVLPRLADFPADADKVDQLLSTLTRLQRPLPVGSSEEAQRRLKVADDNAERRIQLYGDAGALAQLLTGDSPGFRRLYARIAGEETVYDLPLADFQITSDHDDWVKQDQLRVDAEAIERISSSDWTLSRIDGGGWQLKTDSVRSAGGLTAAPAPDLDTERAQSEQDQIALDQTEIQTLLSRIANLSYQGVRMPSTNAKPNTASGAPSAGVPKDSPGSGSDAEAGTENGSAAAVTADPEPTASGLRSEPVLQLNLVLKDGSRLTRTVFAGEHGGYLLQTDNAPQLYELSEYDLQGLLGLQAEQLIASSTDESTDGAAVVETAPPDEQADLPPHADRSQSEGSLSPAASARPATASAERSSAPPPETTGVSEDTTERAAEPAAKAAAGGAAAAAGSEQPTPADTAPPGDRLNAPAAGTRAEAATTEPAVEQPEFRPQQPYRQAPQQPPAPPQWPYQPYAPPGGQPWQPVAPPQGPPPGAPAQTAPGWR